MKKELIKKPVAIASDHAGYALKEQVKKHLADEGIEYEDLGTNSTASVDYPEFAHKLCCAVLDGELTSIVNALKKLLPVYMLPNIWKQYDRLPLNANGKIDRSALKEQYACEKN